MGVLTLDKNQPIAYGWASYFLAPKHAFVNESGVVKEIIIRIANFCGYVVMEEVLNGINQYPPTKL